MWCFSPQFGPWAIQGLNIRYDTCSTDGTGHAALKQQLKLCTVHSNNPFIYSSACNTSDPPVGGAVSPLLLPPLLLLGDTGVVFPPASGSLFFFFVVGTGLEVRVHLSSDWLWAGLGHAREAFTHSQRPAHLLAFSPKGRSVERLE